MAMHFAYHYSQALTLHVKNHHKTAAYLIAGRGVVKTSGTLKYSTAGLLPHMDMHVDYH